jgi:hypothetical protein
MTVYAVCLVLVLSFIWFEILDLDGSDFVNPLRTAMTIKLSDPEHELRRATLPMPITVQPVIASPGYGAEKVPVQRLVRRACVATATHPSLRHDVRCTLPRGLLADPAPSA